MQNRKRSRSVASGRNSIYDTELGQSDSRTSSLRVMNYLGSVGSLVSLEPVQVQEMPATLTLSQMRKQLKTRNQIDQRPVWLRWMPRCPPASSILDLNLLKDPFFIVMSVAMALGRLSYQQFNVLVPSFAQSVGVAPTAAASLVTILAASDTVARLAIPILAGKFSKYISTLNVCLIEFVICGVGSFGIRDIVGKTISYTYHFYPFTFNSSCVVHRLYRNGNQLRHLRTGNRRYHWSASRRHRPITRHG